MLIVLENVIAIDTGESVSILEEIYNDLENEKYETLPPLEIPAGSVGAIHYRNRIWIIAYSDGFRREGWRRIKIEKTAKNEPKRLDEESLRIAISTGVYDGGDDGISAPMDRRRALGNSIIPQIAELLFRQIAEVEKVPEKEE